MTAYHDRLTAGHYKPKPKKKPTDGTARVDVEVTIDGETIAAHTKRKRTSD